MKVKVRQFEFDTDEMAVFYTGTPSMPAIYVNDAGAAFLEVTRAHWPAPKVRYLGRAEALRLADFYHIPGLKDRLAKKASAAAAPDESPSDVLTTLCS